MHLVLSGGRTGTTQLHALLAEAYPECRVLQEPHPSHSIHMLSNAADYGWPVRRMALEVFLQTRRHWLRRSDFIEINPFIVGLAEYFTPQMGIETIVHIVRHPFTWIRSMLRFRGYGWRRYLTPYLPFVYGRHTLAAPEWERLPEPIRFAWLWRQINTRIARAVNCGIPGHLFRFEDLVASGSRGHTATQALAASLGLDPQRLTLECVCGSRETNASPRDAGTDGNLLNDTDREAIWSIVAPLASTYGYTFFTANAS